MWRLELRGGEIRRVEEPALRIPKGHLGVKVKAFLIDDFTHWALKRGEGPFSRWAFGVVVAGGEVGRYVVAYVENAAAQYVATSRFVYINWSSPHALEVAPVAYIVEALGSLPGFREVAVAGVDPRRRAIERLAKVGGSRYGVALEGAVVSSGRYVAVSRLVEVVGNAVVKFVDVPSRWALETAARLGVKLGLSIWSLDNFDLGGWGVVTVE